MAEKIWDEHAIGDDLLFIDLHLVHEVSSPQAFDGLRAAGRRVRRVDRTLATADHCEQRFPHHEPDRGRNVNDQLFELGLAKRREVLGAEYVDRALEDADDFNRDFQRFMTEYCWGGVWCGTELDDRQRSLNNLSILATLGRMEEFELHFRGALRNGCTLGELRETLVQVMVYAGVPAGVSAFRAARKVLAEDGVDTSQGS